MNKATIILKDDEWFEVTSPYRKELVALYKLVPSKERYWSPEDKRWGFKMIHFSRIKLILINMFTCKPDITFTNPDPLRGQAKIMKEFIRDAKLEMLNPEEIRL